MPGRTVGRSVEDAGEDSGVLSKDHREWSAQAPPRSARITPQHSPHTNHPHAGTRTPNIARTFVRLPRCGWEDVRDGYYAFFVFRAGSARTLAQ